MIRTFYSAHSFKATRKIHKIRNMIFKIQDESDILNNYILYTVYVYCYKYKNFLRNYNSHFIIIKRVKTLVKKFYI